MLLPDSYCLISGCGVAAFLMDTPMRHSFIARRLRDWRNRFLNSQESVRRRECALRRLFKAVEATERIEVALPSGTVGSIANFLGKKWGGSYPPP